MIDLFLQVTEPARFRGRYDFGNSDLPQRIRDAGLALSFERGYWHTPPADVLFIHRKLAGLYLLAARLRAAQNFPHGIAARRMPQRTVFELAGRAHDRALAIALDRRGGRVGPHRTAA